VCVSVEVKDFTDRIHQGQEEGEADKVLDSGRKFKGIAKNEFPQDQDKGMAGGVSQGQTLSFFKT